MIISRGYIDHETEPDICSSFVASAFSLPANLAESITEAKTLRKVRAVFPADVMTYLPLSF